MSAIFHRPSRGPGPEARHKRWCACACAPSAPESVDVIGHFPIKSKFRHVLSPRHPRQIEGIRFEAFPVIHSIRAPAVGYRIHANRVGMFYVPDVVWIPDRKAAFHRIRVYVGDGATITRNMVRRHPRTGELFGHATIRQQLGWCAEESVPRMVITHCGSDIVGGDEGDALERVRELAEQRGVEVEIARDGMERSYGGAYKDFDESTR
jgi:phosphoribosyl 1,2-cyclic phosphodiesterase